MPVQMTVKTYQAELVRKGLADLEAEIPKIARKDIYDMMREVRTILRKPGRKPTYPINWDSDKQRWFFIFSKGSFKRGYKGPWMAPYQRTNDLPSGWQIERTGDGYRLYNPADAAVYVYGNFEGARQSKIHQQRHPVVQEVVEARITQLPADIEEHISYYGREKGF